MKKTLLAGALALSLTFQACLGPNNAYNTIRNWNAEMTEQKWLNEAVFIVFVVFPVYGFALLADYVVFNTWGYWGKNPIDDPGPFPESFHK